MIRENLKRIFISLITNPILIALYWIFCYELSSLCMYGRMNNNIYIFLICLILITFIILFTIVKIMKNKEYNIKKSINFKSWKYISIIIIIAVTSFYGVKIYKSAVNYGGKLSWAIDRLKNERKVKFKHNNIYEYGVEGIFEDINKKYKLPKQLYMVDDFTLEFSSDGTITSFYTFVYGKNAHGKDKTYLINYDKNKSKDITLILDGYANANYNYDKLVEPLRKTVKSISIKQTVEKWDQSSYGLVYYGKRNWGYNTDGIININEDGTQHNEKDPSSEIVGYTVSIFAPKKESIMPARYNLICNSDWSKSCMIPQQHNEQDPTDNNEQFYLSKKVGYKLNFVDKAAGSTLYSLSKTIDGGTTWKVINENPFNGVIGSIGGIKFIDEKIGFLVAINPSGAEGLLYRTDDGGISFKEVDYPKHEVKLNTGGVINPFDTPTVPYEKDNILNMMVEQGGDGDYNGNTNALYQSKDKGETWEFIKEIKND
ncbi:hypothetical protein GCM10008904_08620 [Paraclostridium ghonii]|uniref:Glycosyl hydrolase n=1 Tax=Paraclostridium ghonii TaxID=29358 RepID=A0ABU0N2P7_9FIRM|nr:hypothetical protein [Paeniclostridium ghonii]MDQ0557149.1 hypothetical protein [Paeniclostridium ghonii]